MNHLNLQNQLLIAQDKDNHGAFHRTVIYICEHNVQGAMGFVINRSAGIELETVFESMEIQIAIAKPPSFPVLAGGPLQEAVGFVLHDTPYTWESSLVVSDTISITTSKDILQAMAKQQGPKNSQMILGYSSWSQGQLEQELKNNYWLTCPADKDILFSLPLNQRWNAAVRSFGIEPNQLISESGHA